MASPRAFRRRRAVAATLLAALCALALLWAFGVGSANLSIPTTLRAVWGALTGQAVDGATSAILFQVRLPRALLAMLVGGSLAVSGACMQGVFHNPMADPHILGVSSGAALGATVGTILGGAASGLGFAALMIPAFAGGLLSVLLVHAISRVNGRTTTIGLLLAGVAVSSLLTALISVLMVLNRDKLDRIVLWTMGSLGAAGWPRMAAAAPFMLVGAVGCLFYARDLNVMLLGDEEARALGVRIERTRRIVCVLATVSTAAAVSVSGIIGFVGLMVPHALRLIVGPDHRALLPLSLLGGALFLLCMDTLARTVAAPMELPVGVLTALLGGPCFLLLLRRRGLGG